MKTTYTSRILAAGLLLAAMIFSTTAFSAESVHLKLKGENGKTYACKTDASGKFSFGDVEPGTYKLLWVLPEGTDVDKTGDCSIQIESFSWGASNSAKAQRNQEQDALDVAKKSRSNIQNNRGHVVGQGGNGKVSISSFNFMKTASSFSNDGSSYYVVVLQDILVSSVNTNPSGEISGMAINEKGLPGEKGTKKGNK